MSIFNKIFGNEENPEKPGFVESYEALFPSKKAIIDPETSLFTVFDTETTGLDIKSSGLLSVGMVQCTWQKIDVSSAVEYHLYQEEPLYSKPENIEIHGITQNKSNDGVSSEFLVQQFLETTGNSVLVAHHAAFDVAMIERELRKIYPPFRFKNRILDTAELAKRAEQPVYASDPHLDYDLDSLLERYNITPVERHTALGDAYSTALLLLRLLSVFKKRGIKNL